MFKLKDNQNMGTFEKLTFETKEDIRRHLLNYHSNDVKLAPETRLEFLLDIGDWTLLNENDEEVIL